MEMNTSGKRCRKFGYKRQLAGVAVGMFVILAASGFAQKDQTAAVSMEKKVTTPVMAARNGHSPVTKEEAESIALNHAGVKRKDVLYIRTKQDYDDGIRVYEVEFFTDGKEYDYDIVAGTGEIKSYDYEIEHADWREGALVEVSPEAQGGITKAEAEKVALNHAGVKRADLLYIKTELDYDDGHLIYEIEFYTEGKEFDYDIIAATGEIKSYDYDIEYADWRDGAVVENSPGSNGSRITLEEARQLVADRIPGVNASKIRIKEDYDDGRLTYEGEVVHNQKEYEFEIDAETGRIIEWDVESVFD